MTTEEREKPAVWVTRPGDGSSATAAKLNEARYTVIATPVLTITSVPPDPVPEPPWPDWLIFVSAAAVEGMTHAMAAPGFPLMEEHGMHAVRCATVGRRTAERASKLGWHVLLVPETETAKGLIEAFARHDLEERRVWIPTGNLAGSAIGELPDGLGKTGAIVESFRVYSTQQRTIPLQETAELDAASPGAVVLHSPSAADALYDPAAPPAFVRWRSRAVAVAIGPTTARRLEQLGAFQIHECREPNDAGVVEALGGIDRLHPSRREP